MLAPKIVAECSFENLLYHEVLVGTVTHFQRAALTKSEFADPPLGTYHSLLGGDRICGASSGRRAYVIRRGLAHPMQAASDSQYGPQTSPKDEIREHMVRRRAGRCRSSRRRYAGRAQGGEETHGRLDPESVMVLRGDMVANAQTNLHWHRIAIFTKPIGQPA